MDDIDLSGLSGISSDQNSDFLGDDCGYFQANNNVGDEDKLIVKIEKHVSIEVEVVEVEEEVKQITEVSVEHPQNSPQQNNVSNDAVQNKSKSYSSSKIIDNIWNNAKTNAIAIDSNLSEDRGSVERRPDAQNSPKEDPKIATIKLIKANDSSAHVSYTKTSVPGLILKKAESEHIQVKADQFKDDSTPNKNKDKSNGKNMHEKMNSEDLGVLMPLFDWIFWVANSKVVIHKLLHDSLQKRVNDNKQKDYDMHSHYYVAHRLNHMFLDKFEWESVEIPEYNTPQESESTSIYEQFDWTVVERISWQYKSPIDFNSLLQGFKGSISK